MNPASKPGKKLTVYLMLEDLELIDEGAAHAHLSRSKYLVTMSFLERKNPKLFGLGAVGVQKRFEDLGKKHNFLSIEVPDNPGNRAVYSKIMALLAKVKLNKS